MNEGDSQNEDDDEEDEDDDEDMDDDMLDSDLSDRNFRFNQRENDEDELGLPAADEEEEEDEDMDYGEEYDGALRIRGSNRRNRREFSDDDEDDVEEDDGGGLENFIVGSESSSQEELNEEAQNALEMIEGLLNQDAPHDIDQEGHSLGNDDEEELEEEIEGVSVEEYLQNRLVQRQSQEQRRQGEAENANLDEEEYDSEDDEAIDEDDLSEDIQDEENEEEYDEEIDDYDDEEEQEEIEIYVGRNPENLERLSNNEVRAALNAGAAGRLGGLFRRDDVASINNLSIDMMNLHRNIHQNHSQIQGEDSVDFSNDHHEGSVDEGAFEQRNNLRQPHNQFEIVDDIVGLLLGGNNQQNRQRVAQAILPQNVGNLNGGKILEDFAYNPVMTLLDVVALGSEMQQLEDIYKGFIKEIPSKSDAVKDQVMEQITPSRQAQTSHQQEPIGQGTTEQESGSTKSQFSTSNPFANIAAQPRGRSLFGQFDMAQLLPQQNNNQQPPPQNRNYPPQQQQQNQLRSGLVDDIEIDPEFMENLDQDGLQNIAQTENLMNFISNQSNRGGQVGQPSVNQEGNVYTTIQLIESITSQDERQQMFRNMPVSIFTQLPPHLYTEGLIYRRLDLNLGRSISNNSSNNSQQRQNEQPQQLHLQFNLPSSQLPNLMSALRPLASNIQISERGRVGSASGLTGNSGMPWPQVRSRLQSFDQQLNDITDFSRQQNDPYVRINEQQNRGLQRIQSTANLLSEFMVKNNSIFISFQQYLQSQLNEMSNIKQTDQRGIDIGSAIEQILSQSLMHNNEITPSTYVKLSNLLEMVMVWIKYLTSSIFILEKEAFLAKILFRIPHIRQGLTVKTLGWLASGVSQLENYNTQRQNSHLHSSIVERVSKMFYVDRGSGLPGKMDLHNFILQCLRCFKQMSTHHSKRPSLIPISMLRSPQDEHSLNALIQFVNKESSTFEISTQKPILSQIVDWLCTYIFIVKENPGYMTNNDALEGKDVEIYWEELIFALSSLFKFVSAAFKIYNSSHQKQNEAPSTGPQLINTCQHQITVDPEMVEKICQMILATELKQRSGQRAVKAIFADISSMREGQAMIEHFFKNSLSEQLQKFVEVLQTKNIDLEIMKKEASVITSILKFAKTNAKQESNICDQDLFFNVVSAVNTLIERKQISSMQQVMFQDDFRTAMTTLFVLFEYNLRFIFTDHQDDVLQLYSQPKKKQGQRAQQQAGSNDHAQQKQVIEVKMQDAQEIKKEVEKEQKETKSEESKVPQILSQTVSKEKISIMESIEQHLLLKIKDKQAREDDRLKTFIKFCLEHKKVINSFIRSNQQVLNDSSLRNVIIKVPQILDFDNKRLLFRSQIKKVQKKYRLKYFDIQVRRDKVFDDSYEQLKRMSPERWRGGMGVEFQDEQGIDEGGLTREWFILLSQKILNPDMALFLQSNAGSTYYPNPNSSIDPDYINVFRFIGRIVGKALFEQQLLDCYFVKALYKIILGMPLTYHDVEDFDNDLYRNLKWCLDNPVEGLGLTFSETQDYFGESKDVEIIQGGLQMEVTDENKYEYVQCMAYHKLYNSIKPQIDSFLQGFYDLVPQPLIQIFDNRELELLISGLPNIDIMDLKENTVYQNYTAETPVVKWLFEVLEEFENSERAEFIQFVTGSSKVPVEGFKGLRGSRGLQKFQIVKFFTSDTNRLPQAHTCFKQLELPEYSSKEQLKERLLTAIKEGKTFGFA